MNKIFIFSIITLFLSSFNLNSKENIKELVRNFNDAKACEKYTRKEKGKNCAGLKKSDYYLKIITKIVKKGEITKDEYTVNEFESIINTLSNKGKKTRFPSSILFPADQKNSIFKDFFKKDLTEKKVEKIKSLFEIAQKIDEDSKENSYPEEKENEKFSDFYLQEELQDLKTEAEHLLKTLEARNEDIENLENSSKVKSTTEIEKYENIKKDIQKDLDFVTEEIEKLEKEIENQKNEKVSYTKRLFRERVDAKGELFCPNILHLSTKAKNIELVNFIIEKFKETYGKKNSKRS